MLKLPNIHVSVEIKQQQPSLQRSLDLLLLDSLLQLIIDHDF